jgi:hypothetical protein
MTADKLHSWNMMSVVLFGNSDEDQNVWIWDDARMYKVYRLDLFFLPLSHSTFFF